MVQNIKMVQVDSYMSVIRTHFFYYMIWHSKALVYNLFGFIIKVSPVTNYYWQSVNNWSK